MRKEGGSTRKKTRFGLVIQALVLVLSEVMEDSEPGRDEIGDATLATQLEEPPGNPDWLGPLWFYR